MILNNREEDIGMSTQHIKDTMNSAMRIYRDPNSNSLKSKKKSSLKQKNTIRTSSDPTSK